MSFKSFLKKITAVFAAAAIYAAAIHGSAIAAPDAFRACPKESEAAIYLNLKAVNKFLETAGIAAELAPTAAKVKALTTVDITKDVSGFATVLNGIANYRIGKNPDGAFVFEGYFRAAEIEKKLASQNLKSTEFLNKKLYAIDEDVVLAIPGEKYLLYGNTAQVKKIIQMLSGRGEDVSKDDFFGRELALPELTGRNFIAVAKLPDELTKAANVLARANPEQSLFENVKGFSMAAGNGVFVMKYKYASAADASAAAGRAKAFFENGFAQLSSNYKKLNESEIDKTKVSAARVSFVKSGMDLILKMAPTLKIESKDDSLFIRFSTEKLDREISTFFSALHSAFISGGSAAAHPGGAACAENMRAIENAAVAFAAANKNAESASVKALVSAGHIKDEPVCPDKGEYVIKIKGGAASVECTKHGPYKVQAPAETNQ